MTRRLAVVGSINADLVVRAVRAPAAGETVAGLDFAVYAGGKGANQAAALGKLGVPVSLIGMMGTDDFGAMMRDSLVQAGVNLDASEKVEGTTGVALITTEGHGENRIVVVAGANGAVTPVFVERSRTLLERASALLLQLEVPMDAVQRAAEICFAAGGIVVLDPAPVCALPPSLLESVTWLTPNQTEGSVLLDRKAEELAQDPFAAVDELMRLGAQNVLLKLGAAGCCIAMQDGGRFMVPAFSVEAIDTTAAGDAFNAGFADGLTFGIGAEASARYASAVAAISVTRRGAIPSLPTRHEVNRFLEAQSERVHP